ncbi:hypothetical protein E3U43_011011 [Xyrichtys novacula]|uniref:Uncharacterized protein n=1 Tax=Xyrichtys novacula TaxID=13765 RepID=A0AAV1HE97_XYRNO|nr:hypothetical protein E3U43_011011 [Xyrichtys novacula]
MRRRHNKAQYAARERAHLAPSMPHVRREQRLPGTHPNLEQPTLQHLRKTQNLHPNANEMRTMASYNVQVNLKTWMLSMTINKL